MIFRAGFIFKVFRRASPFLRFQDAHECPCYCEVNGGDRLKAKGKRRKVFKKGPFFSSPEWDFAKFSFLHISHICKNQPFDFQALTIK